MTQKPNTPQKRKKTSEKGVLARKKPQISLKKPLVMRAANFVQQKGAKLFGFLTWKPAKATATSSPQLPETATAENFELIILGGGSGGLSMAAVAAQLGFKVALVEGHKMGGDCLNYGCVPSKALLAAAHAANAPRHAHNFGFGATGSLQALEPKAAQQAAQRHVARAIAHIAPHDSVERFQALGVDVIQEFGAFVNKTTVQAGGRTLTAPAFIVATGSRAFVPPIEGLDTVPYLTNETIFGLEETPAHLLVLGGGPIGCEMAQAFRHLGAKVTLVDVAPRILMNDDEQLTTTLEERFEDEGISVVANTRVEKVEPTEQGGVRLITNALTLEGSHLLVATGRRPNLEKLNLEAAGVDYSPTGIAVNAQCRSQSNKQVYAIGDVAGPFQFTHMAAHQAGVVIQRLLFSNFFAKVQTHAVPWVTYTSPQLAHVGLSEAQAKEQKKHKQTVVVKFKDVDRAVAEGQTEGFIKVILGKGGRVLGASIVGAQAGEILATWSFLVTHHLKLSVLASVIYPYLTFSEINKKVLSAYYAPKLYAKNTGRLSRFLFKLTKKI